MSQADVRLLVGALSFLVNRATFLVPVAFVAMVRHDRRVATPIGGPTHIDLGSPRWRTIWGVAFAVAKRSGRILSTLARVGAPTYSNEIVTLSLVGRTSGVARPVLVAMIELNGRRYVGNPNGATAWISNLTAMDRVTLTFARKPPLTAHPTILRLGPERDAVVRATARYGPIHVRPLYRVSRGHVRRAGVFVRLDPVGLRHSDID